MDKDKPPILGACDRKRHYRGIIFESYRLLYYR
jgi:hypothetical protein